VASLPQPINELVAALNSLPGIGPRSAERLALHLLQSDPDSVRHLAQTILRTRERITTCITCGAITEQVPCSICGDPARDASLLCVVEGPVDIFRIEKAGTYRGKYHVLGGKISPLNGVEPEDLNIASLEQRLDSEPIAEVVLALGTDVEGDATSFYLAKHLAKQSAPGNLKITRIAHGLPAGSGLEFADELTLSRALEGRRALD
jgi:recombination protein RecR